MESIENPDIDTLYIEPNNSNEYKMYKKAQKGFWTEEEIKSGLLIDKKVFNSLPESHKKLIINQLSLFIIGDAIINKTINNNLQNRIKDRQLQTWYNMQKTIEDIHNICYLMLAQTYVNNNELTKLLDPTKYYPMLKNKIDWYNKWINNNEYHLLSNEKINELKNYISIENKPPLARQILMNIIMEGLFFQGSFSIIFWINDNKLILPGLAKANEFISRDESTHTAMGVYIYNNRIEHKLTQSEVHELFKQAVDIEIDFMKIPLAESLPGMNITLMSDYIKYVADQLLTMLKYEKIYNIKELPFAFMEKQSMSVRINDFFKDTDISEYSIVENRNIQDTEIEFGY